MNTKVNNTLRIKRGDTVRILLGRDRGKTGRVMATLPREERVMVEGINVVKKHIRARRAGEKGQRVSVPAPIHVSKVQLVCPQCKKGTRVSISREGGTRERVCKQCNSKID